MADEITNLPVKAGVLNYESTILVKKQAKDLASSLSTFCLALDSILGVELNEESEVLLQAVSVLTNVDGKLGKSIGDQRARLFASLIEGDGTATN